MLKTMAGNVFALAEKEEVLKMLSEARPEIKAYFWSNRGLPAPFWVAHFQGRLYAHMKNYASVRRGKAGQTLILVSL